MPMHFSKNINEDFFKTWTSDMAYILGFIVADGCITVSKNRKNPFSLNITSVDKSHLQRLQRALGSNHKISTKLGGGTNPGFQLQIRNHTLTTDLAMLGILPRKTYNLSPINVPDAYFNDFVRGFFDGDGTVYIYSVNQTPQIKIGFVSVSKCFLEDFCQKLCRALKIPCKNIQVSKNGTPKKMQQYTIHFYVDDCEKIYKFLYGQQPPLFLPRKKDVFKQWNLIHRRKYRKRSYPSKIGWHLNKGEMPCSTNKPVIIHL